jgi:hypothetical protein
MFVFFEKKIAILWKMTPPLSKIFNVFLDRKITILWKITPPLCKILVFLKKSHVMENNAFLLLDICFL